MLTGTETVLTCLITGISQAVTAVTWSDSNGAISDGDPYTISAGTLNTDRQPATLTVASAGVTADKTYTCSVTSNEWTGSVTSTAELLVYGKCTLIFQIIPTSTKK